MNVLLLPRDETALTRAMAEMGFQLLTELTEAHAPVVHAESPVMELPDVTGTSGTPTVFLYWLESEGPVVTLKDVPRPTYRVREATLGVEAIQDRYPDGRWREAIDPGRSPVVRLVRSSWTDDGRLRRGHLGAMAEWTRVDDMPIELRAKARAAQEWVRSVGERLQRPYDTAGMYRPRTRRERQAAVVWALPEAADWVRGGGAIAW